MRLWYTRIWSSVAGLAAFAGLCVGIVLMSTLALVLFAIIAIGVATAATEVLVTLAGARPQRRQRVAMIAVVAVALVAGAGLVHLFGGVGALLLAVLVAAGVPLARWRLPRLGGTRAARAGDLAEMPTEDLLRAWEASALALQDRRDAARAARLARDRQAYLDELERRDPEGVRRWLAAASVSPRPFLRPMS